MTTPDLPAAVAALVEGALGPIARVAPTVGGFSNLSRHALVGGRRCVLKAAELPAKRADLRREAAALPLLPARGVPAPPLLALLEGGGWTALVLAELPGRPGLSLLEGEPAALPAAFAALGAALARAHAGPAPLAPELALAPRLAAARESLASDDVAAAPRAALAAALDHPALAAAPRLVHGDAGLHNLLWDGAGAALLDWEWAAAGPPALDLAWLRWTIGWRGLPEGLWRAALGGYGAPPPPATELAALALAQIALILARVVGQPAARAEWLRRAELTLAGVSSALP